MPLLTSYAYHDSPIHRLDPRPKLLWLLVVIGITYSTGNIFILLGCLLSILVASSVGKLSFRAFLPLVKALLILGIFLLIIQTLFQGSGPTLMRIGPIDLYERGIWVALEVTIRVLCMALLFLQFLMWTHPTDLALTFVKFGLPYKYAMVLPLALRFFPILEAEMGTIFEAQQARGLELNSVFRRLPQLAVILLPFCLRVMRRANDIALSMELKGFGYSSERTFLRSIRMTPMDISATVVLILIALGWVAGRITHLIP